MEQSNVELKVVEQVANEVRAQEIKQLTDLQLAFVGGGIGETTL